VWGKLIQLDTSTSKWTKLDVARLLILTSDTQMIAGKLSIKIAQEEYFIRVCEEWFGDPMLSPGTTGENIGANFKEGEDSQSLRRKEVDGLSPMKISRTTMALTSEFSVDPAPQ
ncbi:hypothetical protein Ancab_028276, partial [Ancistrocladus abbreviatus]